MPSPNIDDARGEFREKGKALLVTRLNIALCGVFLAMLLRGLGEIAVVGYPTAALLTALVASVYVAYASGDMNGEIANYAKSGR